MLGISGQTKSLSKRSDQKLPKISNKSKKKGITPLNKPSQPKRASKSQSKEPVKRKEQLKPVEENKKSVLEIAKLRLDLPASGNGDCGTVKVRFNHYNKSFPIHNGVLKWADVDEEYCLSFVYKGNYVRNLIFIAGIDEKKRVDEQGRHLSVCDDTYTYFIDMMDKDEYNLEVIEDAVAGIGAEGLRLHDGPLTSTKLQEQRQLAVATTGSTSTSNTNTGTTRSLNSTLGGNLRSGNRAMDNLTSELKSLDVKELNDAHAKDLIERRDLEDILYS